MFRKNLRSPFTKQLTGLSCSLRSNPFYILTKKQESTLKWGCFSLFGGERGIRTLVCLRTNWFRVSPVMTTSISLRIKFWFGILIENCRPASENSALKIPKKWSASRLRGEDLVTRSCRFRVSPVMTTSISLHNYDAQVCIVIMELDETRLNELAHWIHFAFATRRSGSLLTRRRVSE